MKKIVSILLAFCLLITAAVPAFAVTAKNTPSYERIFFNTKKEFSKWIIDSGDKFSTKIERNLGYYLSANLIQDGSSPDSYCVPIEETHNEYGCYQFSIYPKIPANITKISFSMYMLPRLESDFAYAGFTSFAPTYEAIKNGEIVSSKETYKDKELICWSETAHISDENPGTLLHCIFVDSNYLVESTATYTDNEKPWTNEFLDLFELERVYLGTAFDKDDYAGRTTIIGTPDISDALTVLQYSVGLRDDVLTGYCNVSHTQKNHGDLSMWVNSKLVFYYDPLLKTLASTGGLLYPKCKNDNYRFDYGGFVHLKKDNLDAYLIYCLLPYTNNTDDSLYITIKQCKSTATDLESCFYEERKTIWPDVDSKFNLQKGSYNGKEILYWNSDDNGTSSKDPSVGCFYKDNDMVYIVEKDGVTSWSNDFLDIFEIDRMPMPEEAAYNLSSMDVGDVNRDNKIDVSDALRILQYSVGIVDKVLYKEPEPKPEDPDTDIDDWDGVTECIITCRVCNRDQWMRPRDGLPGGWIINDDMSYTCPDCK